MLQSLESSRPATPQLGMVRTPPGARTTRVALAGCGNVGSALLDMLRDRTPVGSGVEDVRFEVVRVLVRDPARRRAAALEPGIVTNDLATFLATDADLFVEAIGGTGTAAVIARSALGRGVAFVTANKALLAGLGDDLASLARRQRATLSFEAAVAGGVPVLRVLRDALPGAGVRSVRGILNGTTNYILTRMGAGVQYAAALAEAQHRGFAEAEPARDLDGRDAADKIAIIAWQAFGLAPSAATTETRGLLPDPDRLVRVASALGGSVRLLAECARLPAGIATAVEPVIVDEESVFARAAGEENIVEIETVHAGTIRLSGPGAGGPATASAVLADMVSAATTLPITHHGCSAAPDTRTLRWVVSTRDRAVALTAAARLHLPLQGVVPAADGVILITAPVERVLASAFARALEVAGAAPLLVRTEARLSGS
jgi:homoserine dehydrogenase